MAASLTPAQRAEHARRVRWSRVTDPEQRQAATQPARVAAAIKALVDAAPALTDEQRNKLRQLLQPPEAKGGGGDA